MLKKFIPIYFFLFIILSPLFGKVQVVASIPDAADMVRQIAKDEVKIITLITGKEDLHSVPVKPSFLPKLYRADLLVSLGLDAEHAWLPALAQESRNKDIFPGQHGWVEMSKGINPLNVPKKISRALGEQHPSGNPHINIGPMNGLAMAENVFQALLSQMPEQKEILTKQYQAYVQEINALTQELKKLSSSLQGVKTVSYHEDIAYLCEFYDMQEVGTLEVKPGVPPTVSHLRKLKEESIRRGVKLVLCSQAQNGRLCEKFAKDIDAKYIRIASLVGAVEGVDTWIKLQRHNLNQLILALKE